MIYIPKMKSHTLETNLVTNSSTILVKIPVRNCQSKSYLNKVSLQILQTYIFILHVNFENLTLGLNVLIISFMLAKFQEDQRSIAHQTNVKNYKF